MKAWVAEGLLDSVGSFQRVRGGRPDGEIISNEWVFGSLREGFSEVVDILDEEGWAKEGALRDSASDSKRVASNTTEEDLCSSVWQKGPGTADKARWKTWSQ